MTISIIIPTLNEATFLRRTIDNILEKLETPEHIEILVVDAGSSDGTLETIADMNVRKFCKPEFVLKKYESLNFGITKATGDILLFLDADTVLPKSFDRHVLKAMKRDNTVGGAFEFSFCKPDWRLFLLQTLNRIRYRLGQSYYGDQAIFCSKRAAQKVGGYPQKELMESAYFCGQLLKVGRLRLIKTPIKTSPRRFNEKGFFKVFWFDFTMWIRFTLNLPVDQYGKKYWGMNLRSDG